MCRFHEAVCHKCSKSGHISRVCRSLRLWILDPGKTALSACQRTSESANAMNEVVLLLVDPSANSLLWYENCTIGATMVWLLVDTGSEVTTLPEKMAATTDYPLL